MDILIILILIILTCIIFYFTIKFSRKLKNSIVKTTHIKQDPIKQLIELIFHNGSERVINKLKLLKKDPLLFIQNHSNIFEPYGIDESDEADNFQLMKIVIAHYLDAKNNFLVLDFKQSGHEGLSQINRLLNLNELGSIPTTKNEEAKRAVHVKYLTKSSKDYMNTFALINHISEILNRFNHTLIDINLVGDNYELFLLGKQKAKEVIKLAAELNLNFVWLK